MIYIDLPADLNAEDDDGRNIALVSDALDRRAVHPGAVLVAGTPAFWSWAVVDAVENDVAYLRKVSGREAAARATLVAPLPTSA
jgi:hypothetical protein